MFPFPNQQDSFLLTSLSQNYSSPRNRRAFPFSIPLGWSYAFPNLYVSGNFFSYIYANAQYLDLSKKVNLAHFNPDLLIGRYIPNLTAEPYEVSKSYAEKIYNQTMSPRLSKILKTWDEEKWGEPESRNKLGYAM